MESTPLMVLLHLKQGDTIPAPIGAKSAFPAFPVFLQLLIHFSSHKPL